MKGSSVWSWFVCFEPSSRLNRVFQPHGIQAFGGAPSQFGLLALSDVCLVWCLFYCDVISCFLSWSSCLLLYFDLCSLFQNLRTCFSYVFICLLLVFTCQVVQKCLLVIPHCVPVCRAVTWQVCLKIACCMSLDQFWCRISHCWCALFASFLLQYLLRVIITWFFSLLCWSVSTLFVPSCSIWP